MRMAELIDGQVIAVEIRGEVAATVARLSGEGVHLHLAVVYVGEDPGARSYRRILRRASEEVGMGFSAHPVPEEGGRTTLREVVGGLNVDPGVHGVLVQQPLPVSFDSREIADAVSPEKDVDGLHPINLGRLLSGRPGIIPATPLAIRELLTRSGHPPEGKHVVVIGRSNIVGKPLAALLMQKEVGADATVTIAHSHTSDLKSHTLTADILVVAVGKPGFLGKELVRAGTVVVDVGINSVPNPSKPGAWKLVGDVDFEEVASVAGAITPVPGGVGPVTVALLLRNVLQAYGWQSGRSGG